LNHASPVASIYVLLMWMNKLFNGKRWKKISVLRNDTKNDKKKYLHKLFTDCIAQHWSRIVIRKFIVSWNSSNEFQSLYRHTKNSFVKNAVLKFVACEFFFIIFWIRERWIRDEIIGTWKISLTIKTYFYSRVITCLRVVFFFTSWSVWTAVWVTKECATK
jgi:hypothetical protein